MDLLEREPHLKILNSLLEDIQAQVLTGRLVFVRGEAGIGKTSLVKHFTQKAGTVALWGMCDPLTTPRPLAPLIDILEQTHSDLLKLLYSSSDRFPVFSGFLNELKQYADVTIAVFEDVHWADSATLDLIKYLGRRIEQTRTLLILTYRDDEVGSNHPLRAVVGDLSRLETVQRIVLPRLSPEGVATLTANTTFQSDIIYRLTDGNPFFVTELLADNQPDQIPATIRDAVLARKSRLSLSAQSILETVAVIGARSEPWLLAEIVSAETNEIEACLSSGILQVQEDVYIFRHELSRQAILNAILPHRKQVIHRHVLDALEASEIGRQNAARLAYHAEGAGDVVKLKRYALAAAKEAYAAGAFHTVREQYQRVLQSGASLSRDERADLLEAYAQACMLTDHIEQAITANQDAFDIWQEIGNRQREGACLSRQARFYFVDAQPDAAHRASLDAIAILESLDTPQTLAAAYGVEASLRMLNRELEDAIRWGHKALKIAQQFQDTTIMSSALNTIGSATFFLDYDRGCELLTQSLDVALETGNKVNIARAYGNLASGSGEVYQFHEAERYADEGLAFTAEHDLDNHYQYMMAWQALTYMYLGKWSAAAEAAWEVLNSQNVATYSRIMALIALGRLRTRHGDPGAAEVLDEALELALKTKHLQRIAPVRAARAEMYWYQGNYDQMVLEAQAIFDLALHYRHPWFIGELAYWQWRGNRLDNLPKAIAEPFAAQIVGDVERAARLWKERGCPYERAVALSDSPVEDDLLNALQILLDLDAKPAIAMVQQKLRQIGSNKILRGPRDATRANPAGLTNRQLQVLKLLADELTNNEIANRLFISPKTVEHHISTILAKLNVQSRHEAANFAHEHDLLDQK